MSELYSDRRQYELMHFSDFGGIKPAVDQAQNARGIPDPSSAGGNPSSIELELPVEWELHNYEG